MFSKHRLEALSDGIFAIVMTLLVLDLKVPDGPLPKHFGVMLAQEWMSFLITFAIASIFWTFQHRAFALMENVPKESLALTFVFLGLVSVLPFSTSLLGHRLQSSSSFVVYYCNQFLIAAALLAKVLVGGKMGHMRACREYELLRLRLMSMTLIFLVGALVSGFVRADRTFIAPIIAALAAMRYRKAKEKALPEEVVV